MRCVWIRFGFVAMMLSALWLAPQASEATMRYVNPDGICGGMTPCYAGLQAAVDASAPGDVIMVQPGLHTLTAKVNVHTPVSIFGNQMGVNPLPINGTSRTPGSAHESIIDGNGISGMIVITADDVILDGLEIKNGNGDLIDSESSIPTARMQITNCIIHDALSDEAIQLRNVSSPVVGCNYIYDVAQDGINICCGSVDAKIQFNELRNIHSENAAIYVYGATNTTIKGNIVDNTTVNDGIKLGTKGGGDAANTGGFIFNNTTTNTRQDGISVYMSDTSVECNDVSGSSSENGAIYISWAVSNVTVMNNEVHDNTLDTGKWGDPGAIMIGTDPDASTITVVGNNLYNNTPNGMTNKAAALLGAEGNWWGDPSGPGGAGPGSGDAVSANVDYSPWLDEESAYTCPGVKTCPPEYVPQVKRSWGAIKSMYR